MSLRFPVTRRLVLGGSALALLGVLACLAHGARGGDGAAGPVHVVIRYDDYGQRSQTSVNEAVLDAFRRHRLPVSVAVIPCPADRFEPASADCGEPLDAGRVATLVAAHRDGTAEIALHGYSHAEAGRGRVKSEFQGVDADEQQRRMRAGLDEVERRTGVRPLSFVPPFDSFDAATLAAAERLGVRGFSGGLWAAPAPASELRMIPNTVYLGTLQSALERLAREPSPGAVLVAIFHPWDMRESDQMTPLEDIEKPFDLPWLDALLGWLAAQPQVRVTTLGALAASDSDLGSERFRRHVAHAHSKLWPLLLPPFGAPPALQLETVERYRQLEREAWLRVATYAAGGLTLAAAAGALVLAALGRPRWIAVAAIVGGVAVVALGPLAMGDLGWKDFALLLVAAGGALAGALALADARAPRAPG